MLMVSLSFLGRRPEQVATYAREILDKDKDARKALYEKVGMPPDKTVR